MSEYIRRLTRTLKIKKLGEGAFSSVFQHPVYHNIAVKLVGADDPLYVTFLRLASKYPDNPWFPKVVGIHKVQMHDDDTDDDIIKLDTELDHARVFWIVFMQKLKKASSASIKNATRNVLDTIPEDRFSGHRGARKNNGRHSFLPKRMYNDFQDISEKEWFLIAQLSNDEHIRQLASVLSAVGASDIHDGNVMMRDDGQLVITDPVAT